MLYKFVENTEKFLAIQLLDESPWPGVKFTIDFSTVNVLDDPEAKPEDSARVTFEYQIIDKAEFDITEQSVEFAEVVGKVFLDILEKSLAHDIATRSEDVLN